MIGLGSRKKSSGFVSVSITDQFLMDLFSIGGLFVPGLWTNIRIYILRYLRLPEVLRKSLQLFWLFFRFSLLFC